MLLRLRNAVFVLVLMMLCAVGVSRAASPDPVLGLWYTENNEAGIELYDCSGKICGRFHWLKDDKDPKPDLDTRNPDPVKQRRHLCQLQFMDNFSSDGQGHYKDGSIYSPRHGQTFSADMVLEDHNTLKVHGYVLTPMFGDSQIWRRTATMPACTVAHE